jgi:hypothetical protein
LRRSTEFARWTPASVPEGPNQRRQERIRSGRTRANPREDTRERTNPRARERERTKCETKRDRTEPEKKRERQDQIKSAKEERKTQNPRFDLVLSLSLLLFALKIRDEKRKRTKIIINIQGEETNNLVVVHDRVHAFQSNTRKDQSNPRRREKTTNQIREEKRKQPIKSNPKPFNPNGVDVAIQDDPLVGLVGVERLLG